ncbi:MAG: hypothetical protein IPG32_16310 [Saprospirales bacterium]|nr:hypothetical protein [Saprospirales bacterium]
MRPKNDFSIQGKYTKYKLEGDKILLERDSIEYTYDIQVSDGMICFNKGTFCLLREEKSIKKIDSTIFKFAVNDEYFPSFEFWMNYNYMSDGALCEIRYSGCQVEFSIDTINLTKEEKTYIITMLERIPENQLDRIYNNGLSDCREISIDFYDKYGRWRGIETCDLIHENPFEIRVLTTNIFWILDRYLRKEK